MTASAASLGDQIHAVAAQNPKSLLAVLDDQLYGLLDAKTVRQSHVVSSLSAEDHQIAEILIEGISSLRRDLAREKQSTQAIKVQSLLEMADRIRAIVPLQVTRAVLCTRVDGFGVYEPIEPARFGVLHESNVVLYCELTGFSSRMSDRKTWETRLTQEIVLYGEQGQVVWRDKTNSMVDYCRARRTDFFMARLLRLPATLAQGKYLLKIAIVDQVANKVAESTIPVEISAR